MATWDIAPSGGDYTSLNAFLGNASTVSADVGEISGDWSGGYDSTETATADTNLIIRTQAANQARHDGKEDASGANYKLTLDPSSNGMLDIPNSGCTVDGLIFVLTGTGSSDECLRGTSGSGTTTLINNIFRTASGATDQDCVYIGNIAHTLNIENNYFINSGRCGVHMQNFSGSNTSTCNMISCGAYICGQDAGAEDGGFGAIASGGSTTVNFNAHNSFSVDSPGSDWVRNSSGTCNVQGDNCISSDTSLDTGVGGSLWGAINTAVNPNESVTTVAGNPASGEMGVISLTTPFDLRLFDDATDNIAQDQHTAATGAGLTIGDYATGDIVGTTRPQNTSHDIGPFEIAVGAINESITLTGAATIAEANTMTAVEAVALDAAGTLTPSAGFIIGESLSLSTAALIGASGNLSISQNLALSAAANILGQNAVTFGPTIDLALAAALSALDDVPGAGNTFNESIGLAAAAALVDQNEINFSEVLGLTAAVGLSLEGQDIYITFAPFTFTFSSIVTIDTGAGGIYRPVYRIRRRT